MSSPLESAWKLAELWPDAELVVVDEAGHGAGSSATRDALIAATKRFAARR